MGHSILFKQCGSDHMTRGRSHAIDRIVIHYKATLASARNNAIYFSRNERQGSSAHYFVDDITDEIYQSVAEGDTAWHAGNWLMNCRSIGIEVASAGEDYSEVEVGKLARLVQTLMKRYGIGEARKRALDSRYSEVQAEVNRILSGGGSGGSSSSGGGVDIDALARAAINGDYGNGEERKRRLGSNYAAVQRRVNQMLS